jgi:hypothetical protein
VDIVQSAEIKVNDSDVPVLSEQQLCICDNVIPGFSLTSKRWCFFEIDRLEFFEYNMDAFQSLVLPSEQKSMIHSLVRIHADERLQFDDLIKGKGKGLIFLLHGSPGTGKTLTAGEHPPYLFLFMID